MGNPGGRLMVENVDDIMLISFMDSQIRNPALAKRIGQELVDAVSDRFKPKVVLDFGKVQYLSSSMLGSVVLAHKRVVAGKGKMCLCGVRPVILEVFQITKLDKVLKIHADAKEAVADINKL